MAKAAKLAPTICDLLLNILIFDRFNCRFPIEVPQGAKIHLIPSDCYYYYHKILEYVGLDDIAWISTAK